MTTIATTDVAIAEPDPEVQAREQLTQIATGDQRALEQFYRTHHGAAYQFALRLVKNAADAADLVNEAMLEVWRSASRFRGESRVRTWFLGIVNYRAIDLLRKRKRRGEDLGPDEDVVDEQSCDLG